MIIHTPPTAFPKAAARPYPWSVVAKPARNLQVTAPTIRADENGDVVVTVPPALEQIS